MTFIYFSLWKHSIQSIFCSQICIVIFFIKYFLCWFIFNLYSYLIFRCWRWLENRSLLDWRLECSLHFGGFTSIEAILQKSHLRFFFPLNCNVCCERSEWPYMKCRKKTFIPQTYPPQSIPFIFGAIEKWAGGGEADI